MKHTLRYCFVLLALATTGLYAEAATDPVPAPSTPTQGSSGKKSGKHKHHHKHHKKKADPK